MSDMQAKTCDLVMKVPDDLLKPLFELLMQMVSLSGDAYESDLEYFKSIPGYLERLDEAANSPRSEWIKESEVDW